MAIDEPSFLPSTFSKNRERLLEREVALGLFGQIVRRAMTKNLLSDEHFTVDVIESPGSLKSIRREDDDCPIDMDY